MPVVKSLFDQNESVKKYEISHETSQLSITVIDYGATIVSVMFPDVEQIRRDLVLGYDDLNGYKSSDNPYLGATIGRVANRIGGARFKLDGQTYQLYANDGENCLHGGSIGFDKRRWNLSEFGDNWIVLEYTSLHGEEGFPGELKVSVKFLVTSEDELRIEYRAEMGQCFLPTIINLTNHSYFNLGGSYSREVSTILDHRMRIFAEEYLEINKDLLPTRKILSVIGSPLDFTKEKSIGENNFNYDHCFVLENDPNKWKILQEKKNSEKRKIKRAAIVSSPRTGIQMTFFTDEPGFQFYTAGSIPANESVKPKKTQSDDHYSKFWKFGPNSGFCLEAQRFPNAVNVPEWIDQVLLIPGNFYTQTTIYKFENFSNFNQ